MIAVIFEVRPAPGRRSDYLELAAAMRSMVDEIDGFISVERFESISDPNRILSLSFFDDEAAIAQWRNLSAHRNAQAKGRDCVFEDYRLRVASVIRDYGMIDREQAPEDSQLCNAPKQLNTDK